MEYRLIRIYLPFLVHILFHTYIYKYEKLSLVHEQESTIKVIISGEIQIRLLPAKAETQLGIDGLLFQIIEHEDSSHTTSSNMDRWKEKIDLLITQQEQWATY